MVLQLDLLPIRVPLAALPLVRLVRQSHPTQACVNPTEEVTRGWCSVAPHLSLATHSRVAICVGSRDIDSLVPTVRAVVSVLKEAGHKPFVTPAMGSHGGGTAEGQISVVSARGVTEESVGAPVEATMEVVRLGDIEGIPLVMDRLAYEADGIVVVNRVKPHTDFIGPVESGLTKMLVIGLGNQIGADAYHRHALRRGIADVIVKAGRALVDQGKVLFGVALIEGQEHRTAAIHVFPASDWETEEPHLLERARSLLPRLPLDDIDLLIVDEMGKDVSGAGIDPNVTGRSLGIWGVSRPLPEIARIFVRDLTEASEGNGCGLGMVDVTTERLIGKIDEAATAVNALTSCMPESAKIPLVFGTDREAIAAALMTVRPFSTEDLRVVHIRNTRDLDTLEVSEGSLPFLRHRSRLSIAAKATSLRFDDGGNLVSVLRQERP